MPPLLHFLELVPKHPRAAAKWERLSPLAREIISFEVITAILTRHIAEVVVANLPSGRRAILFLIELDIGAFSFSYVECCHLIVLNDFVLCQLQNANAIGSS